MIIIALFILGIESSSNNLQQFKYKNDINNILQRFKLEKISQKFKTVFL